MLTGSTYVRPDTDLAADGIQAASTCDSTTNGCCSAPGAYAGDAACCAEWLQLDTEDATIAVDGFTCESLFAPGRLYAGMCDIACGYCPPPAYAPLCSSLVDFGDVIQSIDGACCEPTDHEGDACQGGELLACGPACAGIVGPMYEHCRDFLQSYDSSILAIMDNARLICEGGH